MYEIAKQPIVLMGHIETICEERGFIPPVEVNATDFDGTVWEFDFSPEYDSVDLLLVAPRLPVTLRLRDAKGSSAEAQVTDLRCPPGWIRRFLQ